MEPFESNFENFKTHTKRYLSVSSELKIIENFKERIVKDFSEKLNFGTAGIRGIMGLGTSLINIFTIRHVTQAVSDFLNKNYTNPSMVICFDTRKNSRIFAEETARVLSANGVVVYISHKCTPTPFLSFCIRRLMCSGGVMITASHNPANYNGYKLYGEDGAQIDENAAKKIHDKMEILDIFENIKICQNKKLIKYIDNSIYDKYLNLVLNERINKNVNFKNLNITYTPLCGAGIEFLEHVFKKINIKNYHIVENQRFQDGNFLTCPYPNPEFKEAFHEAIEIAKKQKSDLILATDPDADRLGVCVKDKDNQYRLLTGNELGVLLFNYILINKKVSKTPICIKSNVSTTMIDYIAQAYNCEVIEVLTGFKNIGKAMLDLEKMNKLENFIFSFEESGGYLTSPHCRDKDGICAAMLVCEMASWYKKSLILVLEDLYEKFGFFSEKTLNFEINDLERIMKFLRKNSIKKIGNIKVLKTIDYLLDKTSKKSNTIEFILEKDSKIIIRPSGTEPKLKIYLMVRSKTKNKFLRELEKNVRNYIALIA